MLFFFFKFLIALWGGVHYLPFFIYLSVTTSEPFCFFVLCFSLGNLGIFHHSVLIWCGHSLCLDVALPSLGWICCFLEVLEHSGLGLGLCSQTAWILFFCFYHSSAFDTVTSLMPYCPHLVKTFLGTIN